MTAAAMVALGSPLAQADVVIATSGKDLGAKIIAANKDSSINIIRCVSVKGCNRKGKLPTYTGSQDLLIAGKNSTIDATATTTKDVFSATGGGKVKLKDLRLLGGMSGVYVEVPGGTATLQLVELQGVVVKGAALHGVHIVDDDQADAGVRLVLKKSKVLANGFGDADQTGVLIEETGRGKVVVKAVDSFVNGNAGDGLSVSEKGAGNVKIIVSNSDFRNNGTNPENVSNPEDGLNIDEADFGNVIATVTDSRFNGNRDDGVDIDESGGGSMTLDMTGVVAVKNKDQGVAFTERAWGNVSATLTDSRVTGNDLGSQKINIRGEQEDFGSGSLTLKNTVAWNLALTGVSLTRLP